MVTNVSSGNVMRFFKPGHGQMSNKFYYVHNDGINILWGDGRAGWISDADLRNGPSINYYFDYDK